MGRLDDMQAPTLVLAGRHDFIFPPEHQALISDRLPDARLKIIENQGAAPGNEPRKLFA
jgi:proline iminopeptidase